MKLCMFSPMARELERGWPGRVDTDVVVQLAAQTLQSFFSGGGSAREHATYPIDEVVFRAPVLHPPAVRLFDETGDFVFANPAAIVAAHEPVRRPEGVDEIVPVNRVAAIVDAEGSIGGFTPMIEWVAPELAGAKSRDFALSLGPIVTTPDEETPPGVDWERVIAHAGANTRLYPGDILAV
ncbi:MAG TPA: hypothetical protein VJQ85_04115 [Gaiellaceae bacterium]|nr:hypothetical protein [Gaiellaceae bacterium]